MASEHSAEAIYRAYGEAEAGGRYQEAFDALHTLEQRHPGYRDVRDRYQQYVQAGYRPSPTVAGAPGGSSSSLPPSAVGPVRTGPQSGPAANDGFGAAFQQVREVASGARASGERLLTPEGTELAKQAALASRTYAIGLGAAFFVLGLIPCLGPCLNFLISLGAFVAVAYVITPRLVSAVSSANKTSTALYIGLGVAAVITVGFVVAGLITGVIWMAIGSVFVAPENVFGRATSGVFGLLIGAIGSIIYGLIVGTALAFLGSFLVLKDRA
ncbi:MAG: hypothetical protein HY329_25710 [Chloroflexi bacterium]|nr:hypothetical protein [Chloroflexota bacterium]